MASGASVTRAWDPGAVRAARLSAARAPGLKRAATERRATPAEVRIGDINRRLPGVGLKRE